MNIGLVTSLIVHTVLILSALLTIQRVKPLEITPPPAIAISMVSPSELQQIAKGERNAKNLTAEGSEGSAKKDPVKQPKTPPPPPPPKEAAAPPPPPPPPAEPKIEPIKEAALKEPPPPPPPVAKETPPPPPPGPSEEEKKKLEEAILADQAKAADEAAKAKAAAEAKAKAEADARAKAEAEKKRLEDEKKRLAELERQKKLAEQKKREADEARKRAAAAEAAAKAKAEADAKAKQFNPDDIMKKIETAAAEDGQKQALVDKAKPKPAAAAGTKNPNAQKGPRAGDATGTAPLTTGEANQLVAIMRDQLARCWNINSGHPDAARMQPKFNFELNRDGTLRGEPVLTNPDPSPAFQDAANAARRALRCASPFRDLPPDKYEHWEYAGFTFDPSKMYR